ncbi:hypothetical protein MKW94_005510 [Papaver nudicaule]|uniref:Myb/SANT-like domain-containing protein n=1 Tax=Papaver nudicaule TaxID=74823 RepID=A0AA41V6T3_PAPNU|nr:hypothetical protein [Papaver nudicaule]
MPLGLWLRTNSTERWERILSMPQIKSRYYMLRSRYQEIAKFMSSGGLSWDRDEKKVVLDNEELWDAYIMENPDEACYKTLSCPIYEELCVLFGDFVATKSYTPVENIDGETSNLPSKQHSSGFHGEVEVGERSNSEFNDWGKRLAPSTCKCGPSKKAANNNSGFDDATTGKYVSTTDLENDPYSIPNCTKHLQSLEAWFTKGMVKKYWVIGFRRGSILNGLKKILFRFCFLMGFGVLKYSSGVNHGIFRGWWF